MSIKYITFFSIKLIILPPRHIFQRNINFYWNLYILNFVEAYFIRQGFIFIQFFKKCPNLYMNVCHDRLCFGRIFDNCSTRKFLLPLVIVLGVRKDWLAIVVFVRMYMVSVGPSCSFYTVSLRPIYLCWSVSASC